MLCAGIPHVNVLVSFSISDLHSDSAACSHCTDCSLESAPSKVLGSSIKVTLNAWWSISAAASINSSILYLIKGLRSLCDLRSSVTVCCTSLDSAEESRSVGSTVAVSLGRSDVSSKTASFF